MLLARILSKAESEMVCDLAETYHIFDYKAHTPRFILTLVKGLREDSRTKMRLSEQRITLTQSLLAIIADKLAWLCWARSKDAANGINKPASILEKLTGDLERKKTASFGSGKDFEEERKRIINGV